MTVKKSSYEKNLIKQSHKIMKEIRDIYHLPELIKHSYNLQYRIGLQGEYIRCQVVNTDGDYFHQCNYAIYHDDEHVFGLCAMFWYLFDPNEPLCTEDEHIGTCSVCIVKESRMRNFERDYD